MLTGMTDGLKKRLFFALTLLFALSMSLTQPDRQALASDSDSNLRPPPSRPGSEPQSPKETRRVPSESGRFALTFPTADWIVIQGDQDEQGQNYDLTLRHRYGASFVRAHHGRRDNRGIEGSLIEESAQAKYLIEYDPESVDPEISTEDYQASAVFCGRRRQGPARRACSLVKVALHGREVVKIHSLIDADTPLARKRLQAEVEAIIESLELIEPVSPPKSLP